MSRPESCCTAPPLVRGTEPAVAYAAPAARVELFCTAVRRGRSAAEAEIALEHDERQPRKSGRSGGVPSTLGWRRRQAPRCRQVARLRHGHSLSAPHFASSQCSRVRYGSCKLASQEGPPWRSANSAPRVSSSRRRASAAWACRSSTARATRQSRSPRSTARSSSGSTSSTPPTCTARTRTRSWSAARPAGGATGSCSRRSSASCAIPRTRQPRGISGRPEYVQQAARRACGASAST